MPQPHQPNPTGGADRALLATLGEYGEPVECEPVPTPNTARMVTIAVQRQIGPHTFTEYRRVIRTHRNPNQKAD